MCQLRQRQRPLDFAAFLASHAPHQTALVQRYQWQAQPVAETRRARPPGMALSRPGVGLPLAAGAGAAARTNPGGVQAIATEVQRLQTLAACGLRVPAVVAVSKQAFVMRDLGQAGQPVQSLGQALEQAGTAAATLALWQRGLQALAQVHGQGQCLSQAFA